MVITTRENVFQEAFMGTSYTGEISFSVVKCLCLGENYILMGVPASYVFFDVLNLGIFSCK